MQQVRVIRRGRRQNGMTGSIAFEGAQTVMDRLFVACALAIGEYALMTKFKETQWLAASQSSSGAHDIGHRCCSKTGDNDYFYQIFTKQGKDAPDGAYNYWVKSHMIGGFAVIVPK